MNLPKSTWYYHQKQKLAYQDKYADLLPVLEQIARKHPEYGVPRIMPELREEYDIDTNHKVIERCLRIWDLVILRSTHRPKPSSVQQAIASAGEYANLVAQLEEIALFQVVYTDFTELRLLMASERRFSSPSLAMSARWFTVAPSESTRIRPWPCRPGNKPKRPSRNWTLPTLA